METEAEVSDQGLTALEITEQEADYQVDKARAEIMARRYGRGLQVFAWAVIGSLVTLIAAVVWGLVRVLGGSA